MKAYDAQTRAAIRTNLIASNVSALEVGRYLPSWLYIRKIQQAFKGEIASLVFANPGRVLENLSTFMGIEVEYQHHVPTIVVPPGIGIVFYQFAGQLLITLVHVESMLTSQEADTFLQGLCSRLLSGN